MQSKRNLKAHLRPLPALRFKGRRLQTPTTNTANAGIAEDDITSQYGTVSLSFAIFAVLVLRVCRCRP